MATPKAVRTSRTSRTRTGARRFKPSAGHWFLLPYLVFLTAFGVGPAVAALVISFSGTDAGMPDYFNLTTEGFRTVFEDFRLGPALSNMAKFVVLALPMLVVGVVGLALFLHARSGAYSAALRSAYFLPGAVSGPTAVLVAIFMFDPSVSPFGPVLRSMGLTSVTQVTAPDNLPLLFALIAFFVGAGGWIAIFVGGLNGISQEVLDAARVDGANAWHVAVHIKLPLVAPYIVYMLILTFTASVQLFAEPQLLSSAGVPISKTWSPNQLGYVYAFEQADFGAAAAMSMLMLVIGLVAAVLILRTTKIFSVESEGR